MQSVVHLDLEEPAWNALDILEVFPSIDIVGISGACGAVLLAWTQRVLAVFLQTLKPCVNISCESCELSKDEESEILVNLAAVLPGSASVTLWLPESLCREVALHVLPVCTSLSKLSIEVPDFESLVPLLESSAFLTLRDLWCSSTSPWTSEQAHFCAQKIRANRYLRSISFWTQSPEANIILFTAAVELSSVLKISSCYDWDIRNFSPELLEKIKTCHGLHPRNVHISGIRESVWLDLFAGFPSRFVVLDSSEPNAAVLMSIETHLRNPECALRKLSISLRTSDVDQESLLSFAGTVAKCRSLIWVNLMGMPLRWVEPITLILHESVFFKSLCWDDIPVELNDMVALAVAMATNEVLECVGDRVYTLLSLAGAVKVRNVAMCVRRCRLLLLSWILGYQRHDNTLFDAAVVFEILVSSELDWDERQRSATEARGLASVAAELQKVVNNR